MCYFYKMEINQDTIDKLAVLSRLEFTGEEQEALKTDLQHMLQFVNKLNELDTAGVEPLLHITRNVNMLREDVVNNEFSSAEALRNAPLKDEQFFKVPKVIRK